MKILNPMMSIKSRYSISNTTSKNSICTTVKPTGSASVFAGTNSGYVYAPYIMSQSVEMDINIIHMIHTHREAQLKLLLDSE